MMLPYSGEDWLVRTSLRLLIFGGSESWRLSFNCLSLNVNLVKFIRVCTSVMNFTQVLPGPLYHWSISTTRAELRTSLALTVFHCYADPSILHFQAVKDLCRFLLLFRNTYDCSYRFEELICLSPLLKKYNALPLLVAFCNKQRVTVPVTRNSNALFVTRDL